VAPHAVHDELVLVRPLAQGQQDGEVAISVGEADPLHGFLALPERPVAHDHHFLRLFAGLWRPVEVDGFRGAAALVGVAALEALFLLNHLL
jgi:hypothetical protein